MHRLLIWQSILISFPINVLGRSGRRWHVSRIASPIPMRSQTLRFTLLAILPAWLAIASPASGQGTDNPSPSSSTTSSSPPVIKLPPFDVTAQKEQPPSIKQTFEKFNHVFDGPFPSLRSGPLIEAILWRHHYLTEHPTEEAVIVTTQ